MRDMLYYSRLSREFGSCGECKADGSAGGQCSGVNTVQHASAMKSSGRIFTGYSHSLKIMRSRLSATEREKTIGRLLAGDPPDVLADAFGGHLSTISCLWHQFKTPGTTQDAHEGLTQ